MVSKCYQKHKEKLRKEARKRYQSFLKKKKNKKNVSIIVNVIRIFLKEKEKKVEYMKS